MPLSVDTPAPPEKDDALCLFHPCLELQHLLFIHKNALSQSFILSPVRKLDSKIKRVTFNLPHYNIFPERIGTPSLSSAIIRRAANSPSGQLASS